jgi:hypothetical protein
MSFWSKLNPVNMWRDMREDWQGDTFGEKLTNALAQDPLSKGLQGRTADWIKDPGAAVWSFLGGPAPPGPNPQAPASNPLTGGAGAAMAPPNLQGMAKSKALRAQQLKGAKSPFEEVGPDYQKFDADYPRL